MTTTEPTTPTVTLAYAMADRGLPFLATDGQHYAYGETAERALAELASVATTDPMADQTTWTTHGVSDAERDDLGAEVVAVTFAAPMADGSYSVDGLKLMSLADAARLIVAAHPRRGVIVSTNGAEVVR